MRALYFPNRYFFAIILFITLVACNSKGPKGYVQWYNEQKAFEVGCDNKKIKIKEQPPELGFIRNSGKTLNEENVKAFYANPANTEFTDFLIEVELPETASAALQKPKLTGFEADCTLDGEPVEDVVFENSGVNQSVLRFHVVCRTQSIKPNSELAFYHPLLGEEPLKIKTQDIIIQNKKKLTI